mgnify:CR=1 FL=1
MLFRRRVRQKHESPEASLEEVETLTVRQQTLIIGGSFSVCGNCSNNANLYEDSHDMKDMQGEGCGVTWKYVATDVPGWDFSDLRPDLIAIDLDRAVDGITNATEESIIGKMVVMEVLPEDADQP